MVRPLALALLLLTACGGDPPAEAPAGLPPAKIEPRGPLSAGDMESALRDALVPSPLEMQRALDAAGVATALAERVPTRGPVLADPGRDPVAVRTGVAMADLLLTARHAPPELTGARLLAVRDGLQALGASADTLALLASLDARVRNGALAGDELVRELDDLSGSVLPRIEGELGPDALPLIRAGAWLEGAWLVSGAVIDAGAYARAAELLRHPGVVAHFRAQLDTMDGARVDAEVLARLDDSLTTLAEVCARSPFGEAEVRAVHEATAAVLSLI